MLNHTILLAGLVLLASGTALADAQDTSNNQGKHDPVEASAPATSGSVETKKTARTVKNETQQELHPDAKPVYNNGGHFGSRQQQ